MCCNTSLGSSSTVLLLVQQSSTAGAALYCSAVPAAGTGYCCISIEKREASPAHASDRKVSGCVSFLLMLMFQGVWFVIVIGGCVFAHAVGRRLGQLSYCRQLSCCSGCFARNVQYTCSACGVQDRGRHPALPVLHLNDSPSCTCCPTMCVCSPSLLTKSLLGGLVRWQCVE